MNRFRIITTLVAAAIAGCGVILTVAAQQPPFVPIPPVLILGVMVLNAMLAVIQTQMPSWGESERAVRAINRANATAAGEEPQG